jgi:hypothetical protein
MIQLARKSKSADHPPSRATTAQMAPPRAASAFVPITLQRKCACGGSCPRCESEQVQRKAAGANEPDAVPDIVHEVLREPGEPLDAATRAFMEPRFGQDFSGVRVHTDPQGAASAEAVNAQAYAVGQHLVFGAGQYAPGQMVGKELLAHELTHVVQQSATPPQTALSINEVADPLEHEADRTSSAIASGESVAIDARAEVGLSRRSVQEPGINPDPSMEDEPGKLKSDLFAKSKELQQVKEGRFLLGPGSQGNGVRLIQKALNLIYRDDAAFSQIDETGRFDAATKAAVSRFQIDRALKKGTNGIVGPETVSKFDELLNTSEVSQYLFPELLKLPSSVESERLPKKEPTPSTEKAPTSSDDWFQKRIMNDPIDKYFLGQRVKNPLGLERQIPMDAIPLLNDKDQVVAYSVHNKMIQGVFVFTKERMTWTRSDGVTDADLYDGALMRADQPISWGIHKAASDVGKSVLEFVSDPAQSIKGLWEAIKGLKDLDIDATWERIKSMDKTDASYVMATLFLAKVEGGKMPTGGKSMLVGAKLAAGESMVHGEEIYQFLRKYSPTIVEQVSNAELYTVLGEIGSSTKLGKALTAAGEMGGKGFQAHHVIPMELIKWPGEVGDFVRSAYEAYWEINAKENGIWVQAYRTVTEVGQHATHPNYTKKVVSRIEKFVKETESAGKKIDGKTARAFLESECAKLKELIEKESVKGGTKIDDLVF